jgi:hypothetical protein
MKTTSAICLIAMLPFAAVHAKEPTLYDRVAARLKHDPALAAQLGHPAREMKSVAWMIGTWDILTKVDVEPGRAPEKGRSVVTPLFGGVWLEIRDTYPQGNQDVSYLGFSPVTKRWTSVTVDGTGNAVSSSATQWAGDRIAFTGDVVVIGEKATLRQTITRRGERAYTVTNEEHMPSGAWRLLDTYRYTKR